MVIYIAYLLIAAAFIYGGRLIYIGIKNGEHNELFKWV